MPFDGTIQKTTAFEQLAKAQEYLDSGRRWVQNEWENEEGQCALAALCDAVFGAPRQLEDAELRAEPAFRAMEAAMILRGVKFDSYWFELPAWNDEYGRTWEEVNALFEDAKEFALASK